MVTLIFVLASSLIAVVLLWRVASRRLLLARLPCLPGDAPLTKDALISAARDFAPLVRLPGAHGVLVTDPSLARRLLERGGGAVVRELAAYERYAAFLGGSLVLLPQSSAHHRSLRAALLPLFSSAATRRLHGTLLECTHRLLDALAAKANPSKPVPLYRLLQHYVVDVTCCACFGVRLSDADSRRLIALLEEWLDSPPTPPTPPPTAANTLRRTLARVASHAGLASSPSPPRDDSDDSDDDSNDSLRRAYDALLDRLCARQLSAADGADADARATAAVDAPAAAPHGCASSTDHSASGDSSSERVREREGSAFVVGALRAAGVFSDAELRAQTAGLLFAGLNSAKELRAMIAMVAQFEHVQRAARDEVDGTLQGRAPTYDELSATSSAAEPPLKLCARAASEALRRSPGIEHLRLLVTRNTTEGGATLPKGCRLVVSPYVLHQHPRHWPACDGPRPELFAPAASAARPSGSFLPFSAGAKGCPAAAFATHEMRMLLVMVLQRFELSDARERGGVLLAPREQSTDAPGGVAAADAVGVAVEGTSRTDVD